jgi:hypothetical protein
MLKIRYILIGIILLIYCPSTVFGWGHLETLNIPGMPEFYLVTKVIQNREIRFCVSIEDENRFLSHSAISNQTQQVLKTWLDALGDINLGPIEIREVTCNSSELDLKIINQYDMDEDIAAAQTFGHLMVQNGNQKRHFVLIKLNSAWDGTEDPPNDFFQAIGVKRSDFKYSERTSKRRILDFEKSQEGSSSRHLSISQRPSKDLYYSTYINLLHEMGHAFGLCDTYPPTRTKDCDRSFRSRYHGPSVMRDAGYYFLTDDDVIGIRSLFFRFIGF